VVAASLAAVARAEPAPTDEVLEAASAAGVDAVALQGAVNTTGYPPRTYLCLTGELACPRPSSPREYAYAAYPALAPCMDKIVALESGGWFTRGWNPQPWGRFGEHASGLGGFLPSTWSTTPEAARSIWDGFAQVDAIQWMLTHTGSAADGTARPAADLAHSRGKEFAAVAWGRCG
jgi:hypothetical protein